MINASKRKFRLTDDEYASFAALETIIRYRYYGIGFERKGQLVEALLAYDIDTINRYIPTLTFRQSFQLQHILYMRHSLIQKIRQRRLETFGDVTLVT